MGESASHAAELINFIAKGIVTKPEAILVRQRDGTILELETDPEDRGRVIGRQGRVAKAMRALLAASSQGSDIRLDIVD